MPAREADMIDAIRIEKKQYSWSRLANEIYKLTEKQ
jgi:hypothetical protein